MITADLTQTGIPQSDANPLEAELNRPWEEQEKKRAEAMNQWRRDSIGALDSAVLDWDNFSKGKEIDLSFAPDKETAKQQGIIASYLTIANDGQPVGGGAIGPQMMRDRIADERFSGRGIGDDAAFYQEIVKEATGRKDVQALTQELTTAAFEDAMLPGASSKGFAGFREKLKTLPGYDKYKEAEYMEAFSQVRQIASEDVDTFRDELRLTWNALKIGGEAPKEAMESLTDEEFPKFIKALRMRAQALPDKDREGFLEGMGMKLTRALGDGTRQALETFQEIGYRTPPGLADPRFSGMPGSLPASVDERGFQEFGDQQERSRNRAHEVRRILRQDYNPIEDLGGVLGTIQAIPGVTLQSMSMAVPIIGQVQMAGMLKGAVQESSYLRMREAGLSEADSAKISNIIAPVAAIPQFVAEKLQYGIFANKIPGVSKALTALGDKVANRALRFGVNTTVISAAEATVEVGQDFTEMLVQDMAGVLNPLVPDVDLSKEFRGAWSNFPEIAGEMILLSMLGASGRMNRETRARAFAEASPKQLRAFGLNNDQIAEVIEAKTKGPSSLNSKLDEVLENRTPESEMAKEAVAELQAEIAAAEAAEKEAQQAGLMPRFIRNADGWTVFDSETNEEIGTARDTAGALKLAAKHSSAIDEKNADQVAFLSTLLEAGEMTSQMDNEGRQTTADFQLGNKGRFTSDDSTVESEVELSPADEARVLAQAKAKGGIFSGAILGQSVTEFKQKVRNTVNKITGSGSVLTVFHEEAHGFYREAIREGRLNREDVVTTIRQLQESFKGKTTKDGQALAFLPEGDVSELQLDEAVAELMEALVIQRRKDGKHVPPKMISKNLSALARLHGGAKSFKAFVDTVREFFGVALGRAYEIKKGIREGKISEADLEAFTNKLFGLDMQDEHDAAANETREELLAGVGDADGDPFSIGRSKVTPNESTQVFEGAEGSPTVIGPAAFAIKAHHGTPHKVDRFSTDKIGSGEGAQAYGWGLYFAKDESVARYYRDSLSGIRNPMQFKWKSYVVGDVNQMLQSNSYHTTKKDLLEALESSVVTDELGEPVPGDTATKAIRYIEEGRVEITEPPASNLYTVDLKVEEEDLLDWDKPLSEQSEKVREMMKAGAELGDKMANKAYAAMIKATDAFEDWNGSRLYSEFVIQARRDKGTFQKGMLNDHAEKAASEAMRFFGIRGIRYLDGNSRNSFTGWKIIPPESDGGMWIIKSSDPNAMFFEAETEAEAKKTLKSLEPQSHNYVVFDEADIEILEENGTPVEMSASAFSIGKITKATAKHDGSRIGTAYQGKVKETTQQTNDGIHSVDSSELEKQMGMLTHFVKPTEGNPNVVAVALPKWLTKFTDPIELRDAFITFTRDNLLALYDAFEKLPGYALQRSTQWYDGARVIADEISASSGLTPEQSAAIIAAFSPMKDWFQNVAMGKYFADTWANHRTVKISKAKHGAIMAGILASASDPAKREIEFAMIKGKSVESLWNEGTETSKALAAVVARVISQSIHGLEHQVYSPEGESMGVRKKLDGLPQTMVWQSDAFIIKALEIAYNGSLANISVQLGVQHKIRNFYNNIISPGSPHGDATIDTHAVNAAVLFPMGNKGYLVDLNFGGAGVAGGGNKGIYWLFHESLRQAAAERGILPRQMQSITWEAIRGLFPDKMKRNKDFVANIAQIWETAPDAETARKLILDGGILQPEWLRFNPGNSGGSGGEAQLPGETDGTQADDAGDVSPRVRQRKPRGGVTSAFSLGPARMADALASEAVSRIKNPRQRLEVMQRMAKKLGDLKRDKDELGIAFGKGYKRKAIEDPRKVSSINKESAFREAARRAELEDEAHAKHSGILDQPELTKLKEQPVHEYLSDPSSPLRGRLMSASAAASRGENFFDPTKQGDFDGAGGVTRTLFGGSLMPDQAAQELFDAGLIGQPTPDAMWKALEREQNSVEKMKEYFKAAQADVKAARVQAKQEAAEWKAERMKEEKANYSPKARLLRALAMLDGIVSALPIAERGRIGGHTQLAKLGTDEARLKFLTARIAKVDEVLENYLKKELGKMLDQLFERAKPAKDEAGKKKVGKAGADIHSLFDVLRNARGMSQVQVDAHVAGLEAAIASGDLTAEQEAHAILEMNLVGLVGNWQEADSARRSAAVEGATKIFDAGYARFKLGKLFEKEDRDIRRRALEADTGRSGAAGDRDKRTLADNGLKAGWRDSFLSLISFEQLSEYIFGRGSREAERIVDMERQASAKKEDSTQAKMDALDELFTRLGGSALDGEKLRYEMGQKTLDIDGRLLSPLEAITATLMWRQEDGRRHMIGHKDGSGNPSGSWNYDQKFVDQIELVLSPEALEVRAHLVDEYSGEWETLNPVYVQLNGINMPYNANYSPLTVKPQQASGGQTLDPVTGSSMSGASTTPGSLRTRGQSIAEPEFRDALQVFITHTKQMEHWKAYAPFAAEAGVILRNRDLGNSIEEKGGKEALSLLRSWMDYFAQGGTRDAAAHLAFNQGLTRLSGRAASSILIGRAGVLAIQTTQLGAALAEMPTGSFLVRFGKLMSGQLEWGAAFRSDYIQRRLKQMPVVVQQAMEGLKSSKPNRLKYHVQKLGRLIAGTDALMTAGTFAIVYDYQLKQAKNLGLSGSAAESYAMQAAERSVDRIAQPTRAGTRSLFENLNSSNPATRVMWAFASESRQKLVLGLWRATSKDRTLGEKARALAVTWLVGGMIATLIRSAWRDMRDDDDDEVFDEKNWGLKRLLLSTATGPLGGIPFLGDAMEAGVYKAAGEYLPEGNLFSSIPKSIESLIDLAINFDDKEADEILRDVESILAGAAFFNDSLSAASSISHLARDLFGVVDNLTPD